jgi:hypothetical protein
MQEQENKPSEFHSHTQDIAGKTKTAINGDFQGNITDNSTTINNYYPSQALEEKTSSRQYPLTAYVYGEPKYTEELEKCLKFRGIRILPERPISLNSSAENLSQSDLIVLYLTPDILEDYDDDLDEIRKHYNIHNKPVFLLYSNLSRQDLKPYKSVIPKYNVETPSSQQYNDIARDILKVGINKYKTELFNDNATRVKIGLTSFGANATLETCALVIDFSSVFSLYPSESQWQEFIYPALIDISCELKGKNLDLLIQSRLSLAVAFGYVFRETSGTKISIHQLTNTGAILSEWQTISQDPQAQTLIRTHPISVSNEKDIRFEVNIAPSLDRGRVTNRVEEYIQVYPIKIGVRLLLEYEGKLSETDAQTIASQIRTLMQQSRAHRPSGTIHLFMAIPVGLAVMIGWHLNTLIPVQCYELTEYGYSPACLVSQFTLPEHRK